LRAAAKASRTRVTSDESWFLQYHDLQQMWFVSTNKVPTTFVHMTAAQNPMFIVFLSIHNAIFINWFSPRENFDSGYFDKTGLGQLSKIRKHRGNARFPRPKSITLMLS
jgi:hypothetical protein